MTYKQAGALLVAAVLFVVVVGGALVYKSHASASTQCVAVAGEDCPSEDFLRGYNHWVSLRDQLAKSTGTESVVDREHAQDEFDGLTGRLQRIVKATGKTFDESKRRFIPAAAPTNTAPTAPPPVKK